jgi:hypothetical protein
VTPSTEPEPEPEPIDIPEVDVREELEEASEAIRGEFQEAPPDIANIGEVIATGAEPEFIEPGGFRTGAVQAAGTIADVPGTALGLEAIGRFGAERIGEVAAGEPGTAIETTTETAERAISEGIRAFEEEPVRLGTQVVGSLALSAGAFGAASAIGPRAGTAARFAIQPGEEILGRGGFAATRAVRGERAAQRFFPNQEPLIFSEEAALRTARRLRGADVRVRGVGAGIPALEVELETETEPEIDRDAFETETLLVESERLRGEVEEELMIETEPFVETELELQTRLRTELDFFQEAEAEGIGVEVTAPRQEIAELQTELPAETELIGETETELELATELLAEAEQEQELELARELELEPRREVEPLSLNSGVRLSRWGSNSGDLQMMPNRSTLTSAVFALSRRNSARRSSMSNKTPLEGHTGDATPGVDGRKMVLREAHLAFGILMFVASLTLFIIVYGMLDIFVTSSSSISSTDWAWRQRDSSSPRRKATSRRGGHSCRSSRW